mgnify:FL=1
MMLYLHTRLKQRWRPLKGSTSASFGRLATQRCYNQTQCSLKMFERLAKSKR